MSLLTSSKMRDALDIGREPIELRERYGMNLFGEVLDNPVSPKDILATAFHRKRAI